MGHFFYIEMFEINKYSSFKRNVFYIYVKNVYRISVSSVPGEG